MSRILPTNCRLFSNSHHQLFCAQPTLAYILSSTSSTPHTEFSFASPVSSATNPPSLSDFSSLPYRQVQTPGLSLRSFNAPRGDGTSNDKSWHAAGGECVNEDLRVGGPILCAVPVVTMPLKPTAPELSRLITRPLHSLRTQLPYSSDLLSTILTWTYAFIAPSSTRNPFPLRPYQS